MFQGVAGGAEDTQRSLYTFLEKTKESASEFHPGTEKVL